MKWAKTYLSVYWLASSTSALGAPKTGQMQLNRTAKLTSNFQIILFEIQQSLGLFEDGRRKWTREDVWRKESEEKWEQEESKSREQRDQSVCSLRAWRPRNAYLKCFISIPQAMQAYLIEFNLLPWQSSIYHEKGQWHRPLSMTKSEDIKLGLFGRL